jgi:hypothetical protein
MNIDITRVAIGPSATRFALGDRVMPIVGGGTPAELLAVHERQLMPVPEALSWERAGSLRLSSRRMMRFSLKVGCVPVSAYWSMAPPAASAARGCRWPRPQVRR